jgi:hypothetical protein
MERDMAVELAFGGGPSSFCIGTATVTTDYNDYQYSAFIQRVDCVLRLLNQEAATL